MLPLRIFVTLVLSCCFAFAQADHLVSDHLLQGQIICRNNLSSAVRAFDGDASTFYTGAAADMQWVGLDLGTPHVISRIVYQGRQGSFVADRLLLSVFEGANRADFMDAVPLCIIKNVSSTGQPTAMDIAMSRGFRYVRFVGAAGSYANVAELQFYGHEGEGDDSQLAQLTELPTVSIHVAGEAIPLVKGQDFNSQLTIIYENGTLIQEYPILTRVRGNFSATHENKPYRIKFDDGKSHHMLKGSARDESPAKCKKWVLINNFGDKTLVRNNVAFEVSRRMQMPFTPWCRCVDLLLNGEYRGTYQLTDHVSSDPERIPITEMEGDDITGGYIIEMNGYADGDPVYFTSSRGNPISVKEPDDKDITPEQTKYIRSYFNEMERRVFATDYADPQRGYRPMLDTESFLRYFLANEFSGNTDMIWQVFMYKERGDSLIYTGPVWDNDLALENDLNVFPGNERQDWTYTVRCAGHWNDFISRILSDGKAFARLREIWADLRDEGVFTHENIAAYIDSLRTLVDHSQQLNFMRWPYLTQSLHCNPRVWGSWQAEMDNLKNYATGRIDWMDRKLSYGNLVQENGIYQIGSARELILFSQKVTGGERGANARLTADIDMSRHNHLFQPIGQNANTYTGRFDGQGYSIHNLHITGGRNSALFGAVSSGASIHNLRLADDCTIEGTEQVAAFVGNLRSGELVIDACGNEASITATGNYATAFLGNMRVNTKLTVTNCYNAGHITASAQATAMVGYCAGNLTISHSYNTGVIKGISDNKDFVQNLTAFTAEACYGINSTQVNAITTDETASGYLCWMLNEGVDISIWRQNLDNGRTPDAMPLPFANHGRVFATDSGFSNTNPRSANYRYYLLEIAAIGWGDVVQLAEFELLADKETIFPLSLYASRAENFGGEEPANLVDGNLKTKYCGPFHSPALLYFDAGEFISPIAYRLYTANDTQENAGRNPTTWRLWGSNTMLDTTNSEEWELIDEHINDNCLPAANFEPREFALNLPSGIDMAKASHTIDTRLYDLSGRELSRPTGRQIVVRNNKKFFTTKQ